MDPCAQKTLVTTTVRLISTESRLQRFPMRPRSPLRAPIGSLYVSDYWSETDTQDAQALYGSLAPWADKERRAMALAAYQPRVSVTIEEVKHATVAPPPVPPPPPPPPVPSESDPPALTQPPHLTPVQPPYYSPRVTVVTRDDLRFSIRRRAVTSLDNARDDSEGAVLARAVSCVSAAIHARREHFKRQRQILAERNQAHPRRAHLAPVPSNQLPPSVCVQSALAACQRRGSPNAGA